MSMMHAIIPHTLRRTAGLAAIVVLLAGCGALDVNDPTTIQGSSLDNAVGAANLWTAARIRFSEALGASAFHSGVFTDEFLISTRPTPYDGDVRPYLDRRDSQAIESRYLGSYEAWQQLRRDASVALPRLRAYGVSPAREARMSEMFSLRGYAALNLAEQFCPGFPLHEVVNFKAVYSGPLTQDETLERAVTEFDSALVYATDSARVLNLARVGKARALLGLGRFAEAGAIAALVSAGYTASFKVQYNALYFQLDPYASFLQSVAEGEGGHGLNFVSAADPRVQLTTLGHATWGDTSKTLYGSAKYTAEVSPVVVANDTEARLIEAEAALDAGDGRWLTILNALRRAYTPALPDLVDPGTLAARVDLLFRERAFWLFGTGHRLGDLRRLVARYGRGAETVFPTGVYWQSGGYGTATSLPFRGEDEHRVSPSVTGCTSR